MEKARETTHFCKPWDLISYWSLVFTILHFTARTWTRLYAVYREAVVGNFVTCCSVYADALEREYFKRGKLCRDVKQAICLSVSMFYPALTCAFVMMGRFCEIVMWWDGYMKKIILYLVVFKGENISCYVRNGHNNVHLGCDVWNSWRPTHWLWM